MKKIATLSSVMFLAVACVAGCSDDSTTGTSSGGSSGGSSSGGSSSGGSSSGSSSSSSSSSFKCCINGAYYECTSSEAFSHCGKDTVGEFCPRTSSKDATCND